MKCFSSLSVLGVPVAMSAQSGQRQNTTDQNGADLQNLDICLGPFLNAFSRGFCSTKWTLTGTKKENFRNFLMNLQVLDSEGGRCGPCRDVAVAL